MARPLVALVGRPNVGKSTLFNRLVGGRVAIVEDLPGTTRDRLFGDLEWRGRTIDVVDTGGILPGEGQDLPRHVIDQASIAIQDADVILLITDLRAGVTPVDEEIADMLRRADKPVLVVVNKADNVRQEIGATEFHALGLGDPIPVSASRGLGIGDLLDAVVDELPPEGAGEGEDDDVTSIAIVGRPNVGKSSLLNALTGAERAVVSPAPGTTRDAVDTHLTYHDHAIRLVDTAGIRRRGKLQGVERYSVVRAFRAIERADVAVLLIDATEPLTAQDTHVAGFVQERSKGLVVAVNKWDLVSKDSHTMADYERRLRAHFSFLPYVPIVFISAATRQRIQNVLDLALSIREERRKRIATGPLNDAIRRILAEHQAPSARGRQLKVFYITQVSVDPPTFVVKVNDPELVHFGFQRFLENRIRARFGFFGTPIRLYFRPRGKEAA